MRLLWDNGERLVAVARALGPLHARAVYVGGAVMFNLPLGRQMQSFTQIQQICRTLLNT
ncbi:MAG: hypothetical protein OHK0039_49000 [Bacteroidia bacterium]